MTKLLNILLISLQLGFTFTVLFSIYMLFALLDFAGELVGIMALFIIHPIIAAVLSGLTIVLCFIIGLPIRLNSSLNQWWKKNFVFAIALAIVGFTLLLMSVLPLFTEVATQTIDGYNISRAVPNDQLAISGWFVSAFALLHMYPPYILKQKAAVLLNRIKL